MHSHEAHAVFVNPGSNAGRGAARWGRFLQGEVALQCGLGRAPVFFHPGHDDREVVLAALHAWLSDALAAGARNFVAAGGDGTVMMLANGLFRAGGRPPDQVRLGAIGLGSSNDFHKSSRDGAVEDGIAHRLRFDDARAVDVVLVDVDGFSGVAMGGVSVGVTAAGSSEVSASQGALRLLKRHATGLAFVLAGLRVLWRHEPVGATLLLDGEAVDVDRIQNLVVSKTAWLGGSMRFDRGVSADDGRLAVHVAGDMGRPALLRAVVALHVGRFSAVPGAFSTTASEVELRLDREEAVEIDGEPFRTRFLRVRVAPRAIPVCP